MFTQLSLFDSAVSLDTAGSTGGFVHVAPARRPAAEQKPVSPAAPPRGRDASGRGRGEQRRSDEVRPLGELAQLVLARYDLLASRRQERDRRRREQPRKSIRVLSPPAMAVQ